MASSRRGKGSQCTYQLGQLGCLPRGSSVPERGQTIRRGHVRKNWECTNDAGKIQCFFTISPTIGTLRPSATVYDTSIFVGCPAFNAAVKLAAFSGSTPIIATSGLCRKEIKPVKEQQYLRSAYIVGHLFALTAKDKPAIRPAPPTGTMMVSTSGT